MPVIPIRTRLLLAAAFVVALVAPPWIVGQLAGVLQTSPPAALRVAAWVFGLLQAALLCRSLARKIRARLLPRLTTYAWYVASFPHNVNNGQVSCRHCGSYKKAVKSLPEDVRMREHSCASCGEFLFVSAE